MALASDKQLGIASSIVKSKLDEFFWEWLCTPESKKIVAQAIQGIQSDASSSSPSPHFSAFSSKSGARSAPSPPGSPLSSRLHTVSDSGSSGSEWPSSIANSRSSTPERSVTSGERATSPAAGATNQKPDANDLTKPEVRQVTEELVRPQVAPGSSKVIPRFWYPKLTQPSQVLPKETREAIHTHFVKQGIRDITTHTQLEPIVTEVFGLSKYFVAPILHKMKIYFQFVEESANVKDQLLVPSLRPITEEMVAEWATGRIQPDDPVLSFFCVVKKDHNNWIECEDFNIFLQAILLLHPGLDFLRETSEFQDRYADTVISRIFYVYDRRDMGRIYLQGLRRYKPSVIETWKQLAEHDDIKMVRDYFSYEHFYVIYCTFWELDADHDFLLDKDDLLKYDGHTLSRRAVDRIFSEIPKKFTSAVPGKMGYEDFIRFLLCDQDRQSDRSVEYWFSLFDLDGDGSIRDSEMKYFYEEQVQRMECLNYETISFQDIMCQTNDMIRPKKEGIFRLADFKRRRRFAGTFFSLFSSLNKFLAFEHRDPFLSKQEQLDNPGFSEWDRWCAEEYLRLAMEEGDEPEEDNTDAASLDPVDDVFGGGGKGRGRR